MKRSALHPVATLSAAAVLFSACSGATQSTSTGLPPAGVTLNHSGTTAPGAVHSVKIPADSLFIGWGHGKASSAVDVYSDAADNWKHLAQITHEVALPATMGVSGNGYLYVGNYSANDVTLYRLVDGLAYTGKLDKDLVRPEVLALDGLGDLAVLNERNEGSRASIVTVFPSYRSDPYIVRQGVGAARGIGYSKDGELFVANYGPNTVTEYAAGSNKPVATIKDGIDGPRAVAVDHRGVLFVANYSGENVTAYAPVSRNLILTIPIKKERPTALLVDGDKLYIGSYYYSSSLTDYNIKDKTSTKIVDGVRNPVQIAKCSKTYVCVMNLNDITIYQNDQLVHTIKPRYRPTSIASAP